MTSFVSIHSEEQNVKTFNDKNLDIKLGVNAFILFQKAPIFLGRSIFILFTKQISFPIKAFHSCSIQ